jgi:hypothetical protein
VGLSGLEHDERDVAENELFLLEVLAFDETAIISGFGLF